MDNSSFITHGEHAITAALLSAMLLHHECVTNWLNGKNCELFLSRESTLNTQMRRLLVNLTIRAKSGASSMLMCGM